MPIDRSRIQKGMFIRSDEPLPGYSKRPPLSPEFAHFEQAAAVADRMGEHVASVAELTRRLEMVRKGLDDVKARGKK